MDISEACPWAAVVFHFFQSEDPATLEKFEADLQRLSASLGKDVLEYWSWPLPAGAIKDADGNVLVRESEYPQTSVFQPMHKYFVNEAFAILRTELEVFKKQETPEDGWKLKVLEKVNKKLLESGSHHYVAVGEEIYFATSSHPKNIMEHWGGPFTLTEDGINFKYHASGIYLQKAITINRPQ